MKNEIVPYKYNEFNLESFNEETKRLNSLNYNLFLNKKFYKDKTLTDALYTLLKPLKLIPEQKVKKGINISNSINLILEFYELLGLKDNIEPILAGNHPMFKTIISKDSETSNVTHRNIEPQITFFVGNAGSFYGLVNIAHESSHAISGYYTQYAKLVDAQNKVLPLGLVSKEYNAVWDQIIEFMYDFQSHEKDCISEVDTSIIEELFLEFAVEKNLISLEDKLNYKQQHLNYLKHHIVNILTEEIIYRNIRNIKEKSNNKFNELSNLEYLQLKDILLKRKDSNLVLQKLNFISHRADFNEENNHSKFRLRYVVGEVISSVWINEYKQSSKKEKQKMIDNFKTFLLNNYKYSIDNFLEILLPNETYETVINKFIDIQNIKNNELDN